MATVKDLLEILSAYPEWAKWTVLVLLVAAVAIVIFAYEKVEPDVKEAFQVNPVQAQGKNIFHHYDGQTPSTNERFFVKVEFNLWSKHEIELINIDTRYDTPNAMPGSQKIALDSKGNVYERLDSSYRMQSRKKIAQNSVVNVFASREFVAPLGSARDYGVVSVVIEFAGAKWKGVRILNVAGSLAAGGEWSNLSVKLSEK